MRSDVKSAEITRRIQWENEEYDRLEQTWLERTRGPLRALPPAPDEPLVPTTCERTGAPVGTILAPDPAKRQYQCVGKCGEDGIICRQSTYDNGYCKESTTRNRISPPSPVKMHSYPNIHVELMEAELTHSREELTEMYNDALGG